MKSGKIITTCRVCKNRTCVFYQLKFNSLELTDGICNKCYDIEFRKKLIKLRVVEYRPHINLTGY